MAWLSKKERSRAAADLQSLGHHARTLLAKLVATQGVDRTSVSAAAQALEDAGFAFIRQSAPFEPYHITPSLWGESALRALEKQ